MAEAEGANGVAFSEARAVELAAPVLVPASATPSAVVAPFLGLLPRRLVSIVGAVGTPVLSEGGRLVVARRDFLRGSSSGKGRVRPQGKSQLPLVQVAISGSRLLPAVLGAAITGGVMSPPLLSSGVALAYLQTQASLKGPVPARFSDAHPVFGLGFSLRVFGS